MAFVDCHEQRTSAFTRFPHFQIPDQVLPYPSVGPPPQPRGGPGNASSITPRQLPSATMLSSFRPSFCPRCCSQFNASFSINGLCPNCTIPPPTALLNSHTHPPPPSGAPTAIPPGPMAATALPGHAPGPVRPPPNQQKVQNDMNTLLIGLHQFPIPHQTHHSQALHLQPQQQLPLQQQLQTIQVQQFTQEGHDTSVDRFMMTNMIDVVNDVLNEHDTSIDLPSNLLHVSQQPLLSVSIDRSDSNFTNPPTSTLPTSKSSELAPPIIPPTKNGITIGLIGPLKSNPCQCGNDNVAFCIECQEFLCHECVCNHEQTLKDHQIINTPTNSLPSSRKTTPPSAIVVPLQSPANDLLPIFKDEEVENCEKHPEEKVAYFCQICTSVSCKICALSDHAHHKCLDLREAYVRFKPLIEESLGKTQVELNMLEYSLSDSKQMSEKVSEKQKEAISGVQKIFQTYREALAAREQEVIGQINDIAKLRLDSLLKESENIEAALESLRSLTLQTEKVLQEKKRGQMLVTHFKLSEKLHDCHSYTLSQNPCEDDSFILKSNTQAAQNALKGLCMFTTAPYPLCCTAMGEGLYHPRVNRLCTVILAAKDRAGEPCLEGGEKLFVQLKSVTNGGGTLPIDIMDNADGSYSINFRPRVKGEHQLVVAIRGQHIQGSPFTLLVDGGREYGRFGVVTQVFGSEGSQNGQFCRPWGICCDQQGNLIIGDRSNHRIQVFDLNGNFKYKFGTEGMRPGQFNRPAGVAVTREGHVVVADKDNHRIQVVKIDGTFQFMFGTKGGNDGQMIYPYDVAVNQVDGRIAVTDTGNHRLLIFSHDGILLGKFGYKGYLCGHFDSPRGIAFNDDGHIIISDFNVHHILVIHPDGTTARILGSQGSGNGQFMRPQGLAVDHMGNFIVADTRNNRIVIMHPSGHFIAKFGSPGSGPGQFDRPTSIAVLPDGRVSVVDFGNSRIQIF